MSAESLPKGHRHSRSAAMPSGTTVPSQQNPQNPHHLNTYAHGRNPQSNTKNNNATVPPAQPTTPPRTPKRTSQANAQTQPNSIAQEHGSKQKPRTKNRPKNVMTSPSVPRNDRTTPPLAGGYSMGISSSTKPVNTPAAAYAGPTFHASPAPSALPIPSFYSKSVPDSPGMKAPKFTKDSSTLGVLNTPPAPSASANQFQREESPLDLFFKADREEKARAASARAASSGPFRPPLGSPQASQTPPASMGRSRKTPSRKISPSGMFAMELDGDREAGSPLGPAFSTPYAERINAAKSPQQGLRSPQYASTASHQSSFDKSEALKAYLFSGHLPSPSITGPAPGNGSNSSLQSSPSARYTSASDSRSAGQSQRPQPRGYSYSQDRVSSTNVPNQAGRLSGLRQEFNSARTPVKMANHYNNNQASSVSPRAPGPVPSSNNVNNISNSYTPNQGLPASTSAGTGSTSLQGMEDYLRKVLKIGPNESSGSFGPLISGVPVANEAVPNYAGSRGTSINGVS